MLSMTEAPPGGLLPVGSADVSSSPLPVPSESAAAAGAAPEPVAEPWSPPSWHEIVEQHSPRVYRLAYRLTGNKHDAEDLTQEVFVRVFRSLDSYTPGTFEGWLHRITTNLFLDQVRRKQRIRFDGFAEDAEDRLAGNGPTPHEAFSANNLDIDIRAALDALQPDFRAAVVLCDIEGLSYEEIAEVLGVKLGTVRSRIHRGRAALRETLAHRAPVALRSSDTGLDDGGEPGTDRAPEVVTDHAAEVVTDHAAEVVTDHAAEVVTDHAAEVVTDHAPGVVTDRDAEGGQR